MKQLLTALALLALQSAALSQTIIPAPAGTTYQASGGGNVIPGTPTDATLLSTYPCSATYNGYTATTNLGWSESCDSSSGSYRWNILSLPVPTGASSNGLHTLLFAIHPLVSDINLTASSTAISQYFTVGAPGTNPGGKIAAFNGYISGTNLYVSNSLTGTISTGLGVQCSGCQPGTNVVSGSSSPYTINISQTVASSGSPIAIVLTYYTTTNGQLTLINPGNNGNKGAFANFATFNGNSTLAHMASGIPFLNASNAFYIEEASTDSTQTTNGWSALALYTTEYQSAGLLYANYGNWIEYDVEENGFPSSSTYGFTQTLHNHTSQNGGVQKAYYSGSNVTYSNEQIWGGVWNPGSGYVQPCFNGTCYSTIAFSSLSTPITTAEWTGTHFTISLATGLHSGTTPAYNEQVRYLAVWVAP